jgi:hypothetical protein
MNPFQHGNNLMLSFHLITENFGLFTCSISHHVCVSDPGWINQQWYNIILFPINSTFHYGMRSVDRTL